MSFHLVVRGFLAAIGVVALFFLWRGVREFRVVYHVLRNDPVDVYTLPNRPGPVEIQGTAHESEDGTISGPFSGEQCLAYEYEAQQYESSGKHSHWETLVEGSDAVPFFVDDGSGRVRIEPDGADLHFESHVTNVDPGDEPPDRIADFLAKSSDIDAQDDTLDLKVFELNLGNRQRFIERRLDPGESVYVYGEAVAESVGGWGSGIVNAVVRRGESTPAFVISDAPERKTAWRIVRRALYQMAFGGAILTLVLIFAIGFI